MSGTRFVDTNVLVYLITSEPERAQLVRSLLAGEPLVVSVQVLNELALTCRRKLRLPWSLLREVMDELKSLLKIEDMTLATHELGVALSERYRLRVYDSLLLASALLAQCTTFLSEDLQDGQVIEGCLTVRNPFAAKPAF